MDGDKLYRFLEDEFVATFLGELIPGIFHNYANPLNGIMGRASLLQKRLLDFVKKIENRYPDVEKEMGGDYRKLVSDIQAINHESEKFYEMFRASAGKFYAIGNQGVETLNLSKLIEAELGFAEFYLEFKHNVRKDVTLDAEMPDVSGITSYYSMALWMLLRVAMSRLRPQEEGALSVATGHDENCVFVRISPLDRQLMSEWDGDGPEPLRLSEGADEREGLYRALSLLKKSGDGVHVAYDQETQGLTLSVSYRHPKGRSEVL
jgi:hypothetical protein